MTPLSFVILDGGPLDAIVYLIVLLVLVAVLLKVLGKF